MKLCAFGLFNNPDYRQEPWKEAIRQRLICFDYVALACGHADDEAKIKAEFPVEVEHGRIRTIYREWPFPEWEYSELPRHLNMALKLARDTGSEWGMRLDLDTVLHESDRALLKHILRQLPDNKWVATIEKYQFFNPTICYQKGKMPLCIRLDKPIAYGFDLSRYTDLCQPIEWDGRTMLVRGKEKTDVPVGRAVSERRSAPMPLHVWNYDYTFRTYERSMDLLYWIEVAHDKFWNQGYTGKHGEEISKETSMHDFLQLSAGRWNKMKQANTRKEISEHPMHFQKALLELNNSQWGYGLWGKIV